MQQFPFDDPEIFKRRLAVFNQLQHEFLNALSDDQATWEDLSNSKALDWTRTLEDIYASSEPTTLSTAHDIDDWAAQTPSFARLVTPIVECYAGRLLASIDALNEGRDTPIIRAASLHTSCVQSLIGGLQRMITPTLILKLNLHRLRDDLNGNTAEKRYQSFIKRLAIPAYALGLFQEYPVLARQIARLCEQWLASTIEFLGHWIEDALSIEATFSPDRALGELVQLQCNLGDRHRDDARSKSPNSAAASVSFTSLARLLLIFILTRFLNGLTNAPARRSCDLSLSSIEGSHGWVEYVRAMDCPSLNLVDQYDECQGGLLALFSVWLAQTFIATISLPAVRALSSLMWKQFFIRGWAPRREDVPPKGWLGPLSAPGCCLSRYACARMLSLLIEVGWVQVSVKSAPSHSYAPSRRGPISSISSGNTFR